MVVSRCFSRCVACAMQRVAGYFYRRLSWFFYGCFFPVVDVTRSLLILHAFIFGKRIKSIKNVLKLTQTVKGTLQWMLCNGYDGMFFFFTCKTGLSCRWIIETVLNPDRNRNQQVSLHSHSAMIVFTSLRILVCQLNRDFIKNVNLLEANKKETDLWGCLLRPVKASWHPAFD